MFLTARLTINDYMNHFVLATILNPPKWPIEIIIPFNFVLLFIQAIRHSVTYFMEYRSRRACEASRHARRDREDHALEWYESLMLMFGCLIAIMVTGMPISFAFMFTCIMGASLYWGGWAGLDQLAMSFYSSVADYVFLPIPLFVLMGDVIFSSGVGTQIVGAVDKLLGKLPGRLSLLSIGSGVLLGTMIGISGGSIGILGRTLAPEMAARGYKPSMIYGPIVSSGTLAILIPPSALAVFIGAMGSVSVGKLLMAIIIPGLLLAAMFSAYIIIRCKINPSLAPIYEVAKVPLAEKVRAFVYYILPIVIVIAAVIGSVFAGVATPSEAAALGVVACIILAALYRKLSWRMLFTSGMNTVRVTVMIFFIVVGSISFSRILATTGAISELIHLATSAEYVPDTRHHLHPDRPILVLGMFMDPGKHRDDHSTDLLPAGQGTRLRHAVVRRALPDEHPAGADLSALRLGCVHDEGGRAERGESGDRVPIVHSLHDDSVSCSWCLSSSSRHSHVAAGLDGTDRSMSARSRGSDAGF